MKILLSTLLLCLTQFLMAQPDFDLKMDHSAILVKDLSRSVLFYRKALGLKEIKNETGKAHIRWMEFADGRQLHIIEDTTVVSTYKGVHLALATDKFDQLMIHLKKSQIPFENWPGEPKVSNNRPDGIRQIYIKDLDGYWFEINDMKR